MLEILDGRYQMRSTIVAAQLPVEDWHNAIADPSVADAGRHSTSTYILLHGTTPSPIPPWLTLFSTGSSRTPISSP